MLIILYSSTVQIIVALSAMLANFSNTDLTKVKLLQKRDKLITFIFHLGNFSSNKMEDSTKPKLVSLFQPIY